MKEHDIVIACSDGLFDKMSLNYITYVVNYLIYLLTNEKEMLNENKENNKKLKALKEKMAPMTGLLIKKLDKKVKSEPNPNDNQLNEQLIKKILSSLPLVLKPNKDQKLPDESSKNLSLMNSRQNIGKLKKRKNGS